MLKSYSQVWHALACHVACTHILTFTLLVKYITIMAPLRIVMFVWGISLWKKNHRVLNYQRIPSQAFFHLCCKSWGKIYQSFSCMYVWISTIGQSYQKCWKRSGRIWKICDNATCRLRLRRMTKHYMNVRKFHIWILPIVTAGHMSNYRRHYNSFNFK